MKVTKFLHSCLLVEESGKTFLIDPGNYTADSNVLDLSKLNSLDYLLITHEHADHMEVPLIKKIVKTSPNIKILSNGSVAKILSKEGLKVSTKFDEMVNIEASPHEKVFGTEPPENIMVTINQKLSHPGDSHHFKTSSPVLALPVQAPWGSLTDAVSLAETLKPEIILPIHDWHWNEKAREAFYKRLEDYFAKINIKFIPLQTGLTVEI